MAAANARGTDPRAVARSLMASANAFRFSGPASPQ